MLKLFFLAFEILENNNKISVANHIFFTTIFVIFARKLLLWICGQQARQLDFIIHQEGNFDLKQNR